MRPPWRARPGLYALLLPLVFAVLHVGYGLGTLYGLARALARRAGGRFLLRIEDIDASRCRPEYAVAVEEDLAWLGLGWERPVRRQSEHMGGYRAALDRLASGDGVEGRV